MNLLDRAHSWRNAVDFALRQLLPFGFAVDKPVSADVQFQKEMKEFFAQFNWTAHLSESDSRLQVLDVGARNFSLAPVFHQLFKGHEMAAEIHGIEIDAYRRMSNFRTRKDYADFFVSQVPHSQFHAVDFLKWEAPADCIFLLNPFVTRSPLLAWGLPLKHFKPQAFFDKVASLLTPGKGLLFVTNPTKEEVKITRGLLQNHFELLETHDWFSKTGGHPRYGQLYRRR